MKASGIHFAAFFMGAGLLGCRTFPIAEPLVPEKSRMVVMAHRQVGGGKLIGDIDLAATTEMLLIENGFHLVNRREIESLLNEAAFSQTGAVRPDQALEIGKLSGAQYLASVTRADYSNGTMYSARLTDLVSGQVVNVSQRMTATPGNPFPQLVQALVEKTRQVDRIQEPNARYCNVNSISHAWKLWFTFPFGLQAVTLPIGGPIFGVVFATIAYPFAPIAVLDRRDPEPDLRRLAAEECPKASPEGLGSASRG